MKITHEVDRNAILSDRLPSVGDQLDAIWNLLLSNPQYKVSTEANPVFQKIQEVKATYPKVAS